MIVWLAIVVELLVLHSLARLKWEFYRTHRIHLIIACTPMWNVVRLALLARILRGTLQFESVQRLIRRNPRKSPGSLGTGTRSPRGAALEPA